MPKKAENSTSESTKSEKAKKIADKLADQKSELQTSSNRGVKRKVVSKPPSAAKSKQTMVEGEKTPKGDKTTSSDSEILDKSPESVASQKSISPESFYMTFEEDADENDGDEPVDALLEEAESELFDTSASDLDEDFRDDESFHEEDSGRASRRGGLFSGIQELSSAAIQFAAGKTLNTAAKFVGSTPEQLERMGIAGRSLKDLRDVTGASIEEVASAIDLKNPDLLRAVEEGKAALPFEILLKLSSFYARNNPIPFILKYTRTYSPRISRLLEMIGVDRLVISAEREIEFVQILRSRDEARELSDEEFAKVKAFTEAAFDMALKFKKDNS